MNQTQKNYLDGLMQRYIESLVYQAVIENIACEQAAKMVAMKNATENAEQSLMNYNLFTTMQDKQRLLKNFLRSLLELKHYNYRGNQMSEGVVVQVIGAVIDVEFSRENLPKVYDALTVEESRALFWKFNSNWVTKLLEQSQWDKRKV